jgi:hypothetical protein
MKNHLKKLRLLKLCQQKNCISSQLMSILCEFFRKLATIYFLLMKVLRFIDNHI